MTFSFFEIRELKEFLSKIQLPLFATNAKVWFFSATIILGAEVWKKQIKPTTKQTSKCISVLPILRRIWEDWNYMYSYMYLRIFPCCIHSACFFIVSCGRFKSFLILYGDQFTLSTQMITLNYPVILSHQPNTTVSSETYPFVQLTSTITFNNLFHAEVCHLQTSFATLISLCESD